MPAVRQTSTGTQTVWGLFLSYRETQTAIDCHCTPEQTEIPVHGSWSEWVTVSECPVTCGLGLQLQKRECNNPAPKHNGQQCPGENSRKTVCNTNVHCPVMSHEKLFQSNKCKLGARHECTLDVPRYIISIMNWQGSVGNWEVWGGRLSGAASPGPREALQAGRVRIGMYSDLCRAKAAICLDLSGHAMGMWGLC
ncbi:PROP protein, partial [Polypterus senegalus]